MTRRVEIVRLPSGVEGLDEVLGGGIPEYSFNVIAGGPGCGKTTLAHQIMFASASPERTALYVTILGEPPIKMLRYQQQYRFFDASKLGNSVRFLHLGAEVLNGGLESVLARIVAEVEATAPQLVFVDSFRAVANERRDADAMDLQHFVQRLSVHLTTWQATTFLIGEYVDHELDHNPVFTVADGIIWLRQSVERSSILLRAQVLKMRGQGQILGLHVFGISENGLRVHPRLPSSPRPIVRANEPRKRTGIAGLDEMLHGGVPAGHSVMIVGPSGSGKTLLSTHFILEGIQRGEPGVIAVFEKRPEEYLQTLPQGRKLAELVEAGSLRMMYLRPLDLSVEEALQELRTRILEIGAQRVAIDSLLGFELALAPAYRLEFRESLYRMVGELTRLGVTVVMTAEIVQSARELRLGPHGTAFLADVIVLQRYVEAEGKLTREMGVVKVRGSSHAHEMRSYEIDDDGITIASAPQRNDALPAKLATRKAPRRAPAKAPAKPSPKKKPKSSRR